MSFHLRVRLAEPLREGVGEFLEVTTPVESVAELTAVLERDVPAFSADRDALFNFAVNGALILHGEHDVPLKSGDEVELLVSFAGG